MNGTLDACRGTNPSTRVEARTTPLDARRGTNPKVRDPVDRLLSSFKYNGGKGRSQLECKNKGLLNRWSRQALRLAAASSREPARKSSHRCHLLTQSSFPCDRKLLFDDLDGEFSAFMREHGLNVTLERHERARSTDKCGVRSADLDPNLRRLITKVYSDDVALYEELKRLRAQGS